jgi:hypothetical protein
MLERPEIQSKKGSLVRPRRARPGRLGAFWIYRLDAAVMLALLFSSEPSRAELAPAAIDRLREMHARLGQAMAADTWREG